MNLINLNTNTINYKLCPPNCKTDKKIFFERNQINSLLSFTSLVAEQEIKANQAQENIEFNNFLHKSGKVTKAEYNDIVKNHPSFLIRARELVEEKYNGECPPEEFAKIVKSLNEYIKHKYENPRIISIGTSPASLAEQLEALGNDVVYIPVTKLWKLKDFEINNYAPRIRTILKYSKSKKINDGKQNIVLDFTASGNTLFTMSNLLYKYNRIPKDNITPMPLSKILHDTYANASESEKKYLDMYLRDVSYSRVEKISNVPHYEIYYERISLQTRQNTNNEAEFKKFEEYSQPLARAYSLYVMDIINKDK